MTDEKQMPNPEAQFTRTRCGFGDKIFHQVCPGCGRPYFHDYIDTQFFPRDPNPRGIYKGKIRARVFPVLMLPGLAPGIPASFHIIQEENS